MANTDPRDASPACVITIPLEQIEWLRHEFSGFKADLEADRQKHPDNPKAGEWLREAQAYGRLIDGLDAGEIVPDARIRRLVRAWAAGHDRENGYERVVFEHAALLGLSVQIGARR